MPIISKETWTPWELIPKEAQDSLISYYKALLTSPNEKEREWAKGFEVVFGKENLQPQLTYEDVARELFGTGIDEKGHFATVKCLGMKWDNKLQAIGRLLVVAKYLNKDWKPDWENMTPDDKVWSLGIDENEIRAYYVQKYDGARAEIVYFRTKELVEQAVTILGEDTVRLALDSNY